MQVGKSKPQIFATCRLENQNPKSLLHAGWEIKTLILNCYMQAGNFKFKHLVLATCRLRVQNPNTLATRRLGNQTNPPYSKPCHIQVGKSNPKSLLQADWEIKPKSLLHACWEIHNPKSLLHAGWESKNLKSLLHASWELGHHSSQPLQIFAIWKFQKPKHSNPCYMQVWKPKNSNPCCMQVEEATQLSNFLLHATWETWANWLTWDKISLLAHREFVDYMTIVSAM